jgi:hypothetical protein
MKTPNEELKDDAELIEDLEVLSEEAERIEGGRKSGEGAKEFLKWPTAGR